jgi:hypothetical protein
MAAYIPNYMKDCPETDFYDQSHFEKHGYGCDYKHKRYFWPGVKWNTNLVICDSIGKYVKGLYNAEIYAHSGANIDTIINLIRDNTLDVSIYRIVFLHLGTNDLCIASTQDIAWNMNYLMNMIVARNPTVELGVSGILVRKPRKTLLMTKNVGKPMMR